MPIMKDISEGARRGLERAVMRHLTDPGVSLIDIGLRIRDRRGDLLNQLCVRVHLREKPYGEAFEAFAARYPQRVIDEDYIGFPVDRPQATYAPHWWHYPWSWYPAPAVQSNPRSLVVKPLRGGIGISNAMVFGFGTLGGNVLDRATGAPMILSNWHVLVGPSSFGQGRAILQPGRGDGGHTGHTVAYVTRDAMDRNIDAAVAELTGQRQIINEQLGIGAVTGVSAPGLGMRVTKSGRRTGVTVGVITGVEGRTILHYNGSPRTIRHVVHIAQERDGEQVSKAGDSGSCWLEQGSHHAVGLHFGGSDIPEYGLAIAMPQVLAALNVTMAIGDERIETAGPRNRAAVADGSSF